MRKFLKCFVYASKGIVYCLCNERNLRFHLCFALYLFGFLTAFDFFDVSRTQFAILTLSCALVVALEVVNTAVEKAVDVATSEINELARIAKDASAGAVFISAIASVVVGLYILWQPDAFSTMFDFYKQNLWVLAVFIISLVFSAIFVFAGPLKIKNFFNRGKK